MNIFIMGCERSGTTMLGSMLGGHPEILCVPESQFKEYFFQSISVPAAFKQATSSWRFKIWGISSDDRIQLEPMSFTQFWTRLCEIYNQYAANKNYAHIVDHTPTNYDCAIQLNKEIDDCYFIHLVRDPRAVANSLLSVKWGACTSKGCADFWLNRVGRAALITQALSENSITVRYEDLIEDPQAVLNVLCERMSIVYHPAMLEAGGFSVPVYTQQQHAHVNKQPERTFVNKWKQQLYDRQIQIIEGECRGVMEIFGYHRTTTYRPVRGIMRVASALIEIVYIELYSRIWQTLRRVKIG